MNFRFEWVIYKINKTNSLTMTKYTHLLVDESSIGMIEGALNANRRRLHAALSKHVLDRIAVQPGDNLRAKIDGCIHFIVRVDAATKTIARLEHFDLVAELDELPSTSETGDATTNNDDCDTANNTGERQETKRHTEITL